MIIFKAEIHRLVNDRRVKSYGGSSRLREEADDPIWRTPLND